MFYSAGLPFNLAKNPHFIRAFSLAAICNMERYEPPSSNALETKLLSKEKSRLKDELEVTKSTWENKGVSLVCNGWTDPQRRPVINFFAVNGSGKAVFVSAVDCKEEYKGKSFDDFIFKSIRQVIKMIGETNVVQVITDNTPVCRSAGIYIEIVYPHIFWTPCIVHTLNLALKNICAARDTEADEITYDECRWITEISAEAAMIRDFIVNHHIRNCILSDFSELKLLAVAETHFASTVVLLKRLKLVKQHLRSLVTCYDWSVFCDFVLPSEANAFKDKVLDDAWWDLVDYILDFTEPIYSMLRYCDTDKGILHRVYEMWGTMMFRVRKVIYQHETKSDVEESSFWKVVQKVLECRWYKSSNASYSLAHSLNPRCPTQRWKDEHPYLIMPQQCIRSLFICGDIHAEKYILSLRIILDAW